MWNTTGIGYIDLYVISFRAISSRCLWKCPCKWKDRCRHHDCCGLGSERARRSMWRWPLSITHPPYLWVSQSALTNTEILSQVHSAMNSHKMTYVCSPQPDKEMECPGFLEALLGPLSSHYHRKNHVFWELLALPCSPSLSGDGRISGGKTQTRLGFPPVPAYSFGPPETIKEPGLKW